MVKKFFRGRAVGIAKETLAVMIWALAVLLLSPQRAHADWVSGRTFGPAVVPGQFITFYNKDGIVAAQAPVKPPAKPPAKPDVGYRVFLPEGFYTAEIINEGRKWEAWIQSFPAPIRFDLYFQPVNAPPR